MTDYLLSFDLGISTGVSLLSYTETTVPVLEGAWQFPGGVAGLLGWYEDDFWGPEVPNMAVGELEIIAEKFTARATKGFSYRTDSLEPLRCEGALIALGLMPDYAPDEKRWRAPSLQYLVGGKEAEARKRQHRFLEESGYYRTNKDFPGSPAKDKADDFRSSCAHGLNYLAREGHKKTFELISNWVERNPV